MGGRGTTSIARDDARVGPAGQGKQQTARVVLYITGTVVSFWLAVSRLPGLVQDFLPQFGPPSLRNVASVGVGLAFPTAIILICEVLPAWWQRRRDRRLVNWGIRGITETGYFRTTPYTGDNQDRARYQRRQREASRSGTGYPAAPTRLLYLIGKSGTGKSSMLCVYVLPELRAARPAS